MLYSTIEEAWNKPSLVESFTSKRDDDEVCARIISQLFKCDGCVERVRRELLGSSSSSPLYPKVLLEGFTTDLFSDREKLRKVLLVIGGILTLILLFC